VPSGAIQYGKVTYVPNTYTNAECFEVGEATFSATKTFKHLLRINYQSDDVCCVVSENFDVSNIILICQILKKIYCGKGYKFSLYELKFIGVTTIIIIMIMIIIIVIIIIIIIIIILMQSSD
jgi:hypothetical protein